MRKITVDNPGFGIGFRQLWTVPHHVIQKLSKFRIFPCAVRPGLFFNRNIKNMKFCDFDLKINGLHHRVRNMSIS